MSFLSNSRTTDRYTEIATFVFRFPAHVQGYKSRQVCMSVNLIV